MVWGILKIYLLGPPSYCSGEPLDSSGLGFSKLENDWELARSWEWEKLGTTTHQIVDVEGSSGLKS